MTGYEHFEVRITRFLKKEQLFSTSQSLTVMRTVASSSWCDVQPSPPCDVITSGLACRSGPGEVAAGLRLGSHGAVIRRWRCCSVMGLPGKQQLTAGMWAEQAAWCYFHSGGGSLSVDTLSQNLFFFFPSFNSHVSPVRHRRQRIPGQFGKSSSALYESNWGLSRSWERWWIILQFWNVLKNKKCLLR